MEISGRTHTRHGISQPYREAVHCLLWGLWRQIAVRYLECSVWFPLLVNLTSSLIHSSSFSRGADEIHVGCLGTLLTDFSFSGHSRGRPQGQDHVQRIVNVAHAQGLGIDAGQGHVIVKGLGHRIARGLGPKNVRSQGQGQRINLQRSPRNRRSRRRARNQRTRRTGVVHGQGLRKSPVTSPEVGLNLGRGKMMKWGMERRDHLRNLRWNHRTRKGSPGMDAQNLEKGLEKGHQKGLLETITTDQLTRKAGVFLSESFFFDSWRPSDACMRR